MHKNTVPVEVKCPNCDHTEIVYLQKEDIQKCPKCDIQMIIIELLREGKSF